MEIKFMPSVNFVCFQRQRRKVGTIYTLTLSTTTGIRTINSKLFTGGGGGSNGVTSIIH